MRRLSMRRVLSLSTVSLAATVAACGGSSSTSPPPPPPTSAPTVTPTPNPTITPTPVPTLGGHLYVGGGPGGSGGGYVERFPIVAGAPRSPADVTFPSVTWPIALDGLNNLYATARSGTSVEVFPPGSTTPSRSLSIIVRHAFSFTLFSLAVGGRGYLYASYGATLKDGATETGVLVYGPAAQGNTPPLRRIVTSGGEIGGGMALDMTGDILVSTLTPAAVLTYSSPTGAPKLIRTLAGLPGIGGPLGLAIDSSSELYVDNSLTSGSNVAVFPVNSTNPHPDRQLFVPGAVRFGFGIATSVGELFVPDAGRNMVYELPAGANGMTQPTATLPVSLPEDVKIGP